MRILYVARYWHPSLERKLVLMAAYPDVHVLLLRPSRPEDATGGAPAGPDAATRYRAVAVPLRWRPHDPHRALYRTRTFSPRPFRPELIHAEEEPDSLAALQVALARRLLAPRARLILHTWQNVNRAKAWHVRTVTRIALRQADAILCANTEGVRVLTEMGYRGPTAVLPPQGVDLSLFHPAADAGTRGGRFTVLYAGRLAPEKGLETLIEAMRDVPSPAGLLVIGNGSHRPQLEASARRAGVRDRVEFVPAVAPEELARRYRQADVLVLPSRTTPVWKEQFGRVLIEAMACRLPVVGSDSGAIPEVIGDAGLIFPEGDAGALAAHLVRLMRCPGFGAELAARAYQRVLDRYTQEHIAARTLHAYRRVLQ